jgi:glycogen debranching enzyme
MEFVRSSKLWENSYFLSNRHSFFHRFADSGFKNKWTGLWHRETKFLEYLAFRADGEWLSEGNCRSLAYDGLKAVHTFKTKGNLITQTISLPETGHLLVEISAKEPVNLELKLAVNVRKRSENMTPRLYSVRKSGKALTIYNSLGSLRVSGTPDLRFEEAPVYREHHPSGEPQNYFIPGRITASGKSIAFAFTPSLTSERPSAPNLEKSLKENQHSLSALKGLIKTDNRLLKRGFLWSVLATELCRKKSQGLTSWYAGLPWFQHFWARDIFWVVPSLTALGYFRDVRKTLEFFASFSENGRIPNQVSETEGRHMNALDPTPLWITSLENYVMNSGDIVFLRRMRPYLEASMRYLFSRDTDGDGYIEHDQDFPETWMDTLKRDSRAADIQALYYRALLSAHTLLSLLPGRKDLLGEISSRAVFLSNNFERDFFHNGFFADRLFWGQAVAIRTANALVPLLCGFRGHSREILDAIESEPFTTGMGVRTRAGGEAEFDPGGYHTGASWSLTTAWACAAEFLAGRPTKGWRYLKTLLKDMDRESLGCIGECWNSSSLTLSGCPLQLWGSGFVPRLVDEFMLGIEINSLDRTIKVSPWLPPGTGRIERPRRTGHGHLRLGFRKSGSSVRVSCSDRCFRIIKTHSSE